MIKVNKFGLFIVLIVFFSLFLLFFNITIVKFSQVQLNRSLFETQFNEVNHQSFSGIASRLNIKLLSFEEEDLTQVNKPLLREEVRLAVLENNLEHDNTPYYKEENLDLDVALFIYTRDYILNIVNVKTITPEEGIRFLEEMNKAYTYLRLRHYYKAIESYTILLDNPSPMINIPSRIFRAYSYFMSGNHRGALEDLKILEEVKEPEYLLIITYLLKRMNLLYRKMEENPLYFYSPDRKIA